MSQTKEHVFLASSKYVADLEAEIKYKKSLKLTEEDQNLFWVKGDKVSLWWPQWQLWNVSYEKIDSISQASRFLRSQGKCWLNLDYKWHRRTTLIQEGLPKIKIPKINRGEIVKADLCGAWFLKEPGLLCYSKDISLPFTNGIIPIQEDKEAPSRAFHKLDEVFARLGKFPSKTDRVIDLGSYPGGWTWVLSQIAGKVISVDTVNLEEKISKLRNVELIKKDAFKLAPSDIGRVDWFFSDIICEPARLFELVNIWKQSGHVGNFVCTIKFKGSVDFNLLEQFKKIPGSELFHLNANKHELTWVCLR